MAFWNKRRGGPRSNEMGAGGDASAAAEDLSANQGSRGLPSFQESVGGATRSTRSDPLRARMRTAFTPSQPVSDVRMFAGRHDLLRSIIRAIEDQHLHVVLFGDRGIGKTSTLHVLSELAGKAGYVVRYTSSGESSSFDEIFRSVLADVPLLYHADFDPALGSAEGQDTLASILPPHPLTVADVTRIMGKLTATRLLIILDEFDRCESEQFRRSIAELVKNLSDRSLPVQLVIGGVAANLSELIEYLPSIRRNILGLPMPSMTTGELKEIVAIGSAVSGLPYEAEAVEQIAESANGSPYLGSLLGQHAGIAALDRGAEEVSRRDVQAAIALALREMELRISPESLRAIRGVTDAALQATLATLAREALTTLGRVETPELAAHRVAIDRPNLDRLEREHGVIERTTAGGVEAYRFRDQSAPLLVWLQKLQADVAPEGRG